MTSGPTGRRPDPTDPREPGPGRPGDQRPGHPGDRGRTGGTAEPPRRLVVGISGASGAVLGIRALELLREHGGVETHLVISHGARSAITEETGYTVAEVAALADVAHRANDLGAAIASGSFRTDGMLVAPCSVKTLAGIAHSYADTLLVRAADVTLKERRRLVLLVRETPLHAGHLRLMSEATAAGAVIMPPVPAYYIRPTRVAELVDHTVLRALELLGHTSGAMPRWSGRGSFSGPGDPAGERPEERGPATPGRPGGGGPQAPA